MEYAYGLLRTFKYFYDEMNTATLTGAIDVVVVEQPDGTYSCSPFHVRFGKYGVMHAREKVVDIEINGNPIDIHMKLGENGEAFFVDNVDHDQDIPDHLATSPFPYDGAQATEQLIKDGLMNLKSGGETTLRSRVRAGSQSEFDLEDHPNLQYRRISSLPSLITRAQQRKPRAKTTESIDDIDGEKGNDESIFYLEEDTTQRDSMSADEDNDKTPVVEQKEQIDWSSRGRKISRVRYPCMSDSDISAPSSREHSPSALSDSEVGRISKQELKLSELPNDIPEWKWGELPDATPTQERPPNSATSDPGVDKSISWGLFNWSRKQKEDMDGLYLDDLESVEDPNARARYLNVRNTSGGSTKGKATDEVLIIDETKQPAIHSTSLDEERGEEKQDISEKQEDDSVTESMDKFLSEPTQEQPNHHQTDGGYASNPSSIAPEGRASPWSFEFGELLEDVALSLCGSEVLEDGLITPELFAQKLLTLEDFKEDPLKYLDDQSLVMRIGGKYYPRKVALAMIMSLVGFQKPLPEETLNKLMSDYQSKKEQQQQQQSRGWFSWRRAASADPPISPKKDELTSTSESGSPRPEDKSEQLHTPTAISISIDNSSPSSPNRRYIRSLRLSSDQLKSLGLKPGVNDGQFSVTTKFQGTTWCVCHIWLWKWTDKIVISDVDGTITKSDVLGHILPVMGAQWAQAGVADLYTRIKANGYKVLYLSSRAIGQSHQTKAYLRSIAQDNDLTLPDGPLLLSPTSLMLAFHKEVIEKRPEEFKTAALSDIKALFPNDVNPFYAGFGNRVNDVVAYKAVGMPLDRILTINPKGEVRRADSIGFVSSYKGMAMDVVDYIFPPLPIDGSDPTPSPQEDYGGFYHWRRNSSFMSTDQLLDDDLLKQYESKRSNTKPDAPEK